MAKVGRNDPCLCGSGKKFKRCCLERVEAEERADRLKAESERLAAEGDEGPTIAAVVERARAVLQESRAFEEVDGLAERVLELIDAGQYDEAEATARQLESEYPDEPLAIERLGQVHEARGSGDSAAEQYRRAVTLMDELGEGHYCDCCRARLVKAIRRLDPDRPAPALLRDPQ
jgi:tetratricopeptide (TPR) repeat protein